MIYMQKNKLIIIIIIIIIIIGRIVFLDLFFLAGS